MPLAFADKDQTVTYKATKDGKKGRTFTITLESSRDICKLRIAPPVSIDGSRAVLARSTLLRRRPVSQSSVEPVPALSASVQMR